MVAGKLVVLISPTDRQRDAIRLTEAGVRVVATSRMESSPRQILDASPVAIVVEFVSSLAEDTLAYLSQLGLASRVRHIPLIAYGTEVSAAHQASIQQLGAEWVPLGDDRGALVTAVRQALSPAPQPVAP